MAKGGLGLGLELVAKGGLGLALETTWVRLLYLIPLIIAIARNLAPIA